MALERRGGGVYYYTTRRVYSRVVKEYGGSGYVAELAARMDATQRELRRLDRMEPRIELDFLRAEVTCQREWLDAADRLVAEALERSGWHNVRRQWRRKRGGAVAALQCVSELSWVSSDLVAATGEIDPDTAEKAKRGDKAVLKAVDEFLAHPAAKAYWGHVGRHVLNTWVKKYAGSNEAMLRFSSDLRAKLAGPDPSALDLVVVERVVLG
jgi:hypothetical protein